MERPRLESFEQNKRTEAQGDSGDQAREDEKAAGDKLRQEARPQDKAAEGQLTPIDKRAFATAHGVKLVARDNRLQYVVHVGGNDRVLFDTDATKDGLAEGLRKLDALKESKQNELAHKYGVAFAKAGDKPDRQWIVKDDGTLERGDLVNSRTPNLPELYGIEAALLRSEPSHLSKDGKQAVKFYFLSEPYIKNDTGMTLATYINKDVNNRPAVLIAPSGTLDRPITEIDAQQLQQTDDHSIESLLIHELAHNMQYTLSWDVSDTLEAVSAKLGWAPFEHPKTKETIWVIKAKDGALYQYQADTDNWARLNKDGDPLDKNGNLVATKKDAHHLETGEMRAQALVKPITDYFDNACEMMSEAVTYFRLSRPRRAELNRESPQLYAFIKEQDQLEVNKLRGTTADGKPLFIRSADGLLVSNNAANAKAVADFESAIEGQKK